jgi:4-amino-4-deoxy-L-arabinose transferase-like glycosyltransferase
LTLNEQLGVEQVKPGKRWRVETPRNFLYLCFLLLLLHSACMLGRYGELPSAPVIGDEVTINDPAIALSRGQGLRAPSFSGSAFGLDHFYAHFPPLYIWTESLVFRIFGVSVYSLRLTTTVMGILACATFLFIAWCLCRWGLADPVTMSFAACLYTLNASVIALHRIARMDTMVEFLALASLLFVLAGIFSRFDSAASAPEDRSNASRIRRFVLLLAGAISAGLCMATHPEGLTAILPVLLLIVCAAPVRRGGKAMLLALVAVIPVTIWMMAYGSRWKQGIDQMRMILRDITPQPGILRYAHDFLRRNQPYIGQGMRAALFFLCLLVLGLLLERWVILWRSKRGITCLGEPSQKRFLLTSVFALAAFLSLFLLICFISASITRYEVMYPIYLLGLVMALRGVSLDKTGRRIAAGLVTALIVAQIAAIAVYFREEGDRPGRFDSIVEMIPSGLRIAVTPKMWLAFVQKGRPVTLLYLGYDGRKLWSTESRNPLQGFDVIVIDESFVDERREYSPLAQEGRVERDYRVGRNVIHVYLPAK